MNWEAFVIIGGGALLIGVLLIVPSLWVSKRLSGKRAQRIRLQRRRAYQDELIAAEKIKLPWWFGVLIGLCVVAAGVWGAWLGISEGIVDQSITLGGSKYRRMDQPLPHYTGSGAVLAGTFLFLIGLVVAGFGLWAIRVSMRSKSSG